MLIAALMGLTPCIASAASPAVTHVVANAWQSTDFHDAANPGCSIGGSGSMPGSRLILGASRRQPDPMSLVIRKAGWTIPAGTAVPVSASFADGAAIRFSGTGNGDAIQIALGAEQLRPFVHELTAGAVMQVSFGGNEPAWTFDLSGATQVVNAMGDCFQAHQITGVAPPFGPSAATSPAPFYAPPLFGGAAPQPADSPQQPTSPDAFLDPALLTCTEILQVQDALIWTGHYVGLKDGAWGKSTIAGIRSWRQDAHLPSAVSLRPAEMASLLAQAAATKGAVGWKTLVDPASGAAIGIPERLVTPSPLADGTSYTGDRGVAFVVRRYTMPADAIKAALAAQAAAPDVQRVNYRLDKPDRQVLSFDSTDGYSVYIRLDRAGFEWKGFQAKIRHDGPDYGNMITAFSADFDASGALPLDAGAVSYPAPAIQAPLQPSAPPAPPAIVSAPPSPPSESPPRYNSPDPVPQPPVADNRERHPTAPASTPDSAIGPYLPIIAGIGAGVVLLFFRNFFVVAALIAGGVLAYPVLNEQTGSACHALEKRGIALVIAATKDQTTDPLVALFAGALADKFLDGSLASSLVKQKYPDLPPFVGCTAAYWETFFDPDLARSLSDLAKQH